MKPAHLPTEAPLEHVERAYLRGGERAAAHRLYRTDLLTAPLDDIAGKVALVYFDPPFGTGDRFEANVELGETRLHVPAYDDVWESGLDGLLAWIEPRLRAIHALLADDGSLFLHADHRATPYLAILCDRIFGRGDREGTGTRSGFRNEIIWRYGLGGSSNRSYPKKHDVLLWYTKGETWFFEAPRVPATSRRMAGMDKKCPDVWDIPTLNNMAKERNGYPTQKPEALLERIITAHTREGELVLDPGFGSGTSALVAHKLGRRYVGTDPSHVAFDRTRSRLHVADASSVVGSVESHARSAPGEAAHVTLNAGEGSLEVVGVTLPDDARVTGFTDHVASLEAVARLVIAPSTRGLFVHRAEDVLGPRRVRRTATHEDPVALRVTDVLGRTFGYSGPIPAHAGPITLTFTRVL